MSLKLRAGIHTYADIPTYAGLHTYIHACIEIVDIYGTRYIRTVGDRRYGSKDGSSRHRRSRGTPHSYPTYMPCPARNRTRFCKIRNALYVWQQASTPRYAYYRCARLRTIHVRIRIHGMYVYQVRGDTKLNEKVRFIFEMTFSARFSPTSDSAILLVQGRKVQRTDASFFDFQCFDVSFERVFEYSSFFILVLVATCSFLYTGNTAASDTCSCRAPRQHSLCGHDHRLR